MAIKSEDEYKASLRSSGFSTVVTWTDGPYPQDSGAKKITYGPGDVVDVEAGRDHEVWIGREGCTCIIGE
ncbi:MAG: hypothetical protein M1818_007351 [Claussenomyces sp. TS43310]|nr:MAG: hypothetical protein M1818_007351 [Claussenomyces sp. TS43310]